MHTLEQLRTGQLAGSTRLDLAAGLTEFPPEIFALADTLEILNLTGNQLRELPAELPRLHRLRILFCSDNQFEELPAVLGQCPELRMVGFKANQIRRVPAEALPPKLRWLILTDNQLESLPPEIGRCHELQKLMLAGNQLRELPAELAQCHSLELLRLAANRLDYLPAWLLTLPRLSWLAYAGNDFADRYEAAVAARHPAPSIDWTALHLREQLGEGASGVISRADWSRHGAPQQVAVKLFKGAVTSDGLPRSEMDACLSAGRHPNLIAVDGRISGHPAGTEGLVLELIDPAFHTLAGPPSFATCTRDVYPAGTAFSLPVALRIARGMAAVGAHLHAQGILHGDLYAHNILVRPQDGYALLGDFGAASFFEPATEQATALQRLEVRAFGCLLEELLNQCTEPVPESLWDLQRRCGQPDTAARPLFADIEHELIHTATHHA
jgi:Protein tyrosine and serine/threonine kinase/Leucine rich repeat